MVVSSEQKPIVRFEGITKKFPGIVALSDVNVSISAGSCHGLVGENGAGKSTLGKILAGIHQHDGGKIYVDEKPVRFASPTDALAAGIGIVHQEIAFCENMSVAENLCLEHLPRVGIFTSRKKMFELADELLQSIDAKVDVKRPIGELTISQQQMVQIAAAVGRGARVIVFDEPTSSLSMAESEKLFELMKRIQKDGVTSIYVSHRMPEIFRLCDTITVLRDGKVAGTKKIENLDENTLVELMIGRKLEEYFPNHCKSEPGKEVLKVENLTVKGKFKDISFGLREGEVLGFAGLVGAGRTEVAETIFGLNRASSGNLYVDGKLCKINKPTDAIKLRLGLVPEDRKRHGLVLSMSCKANLTLPILERLAKLSWVLKGKEEGVVQKYFNQLRVKAGGLDALVASLSGGNQQKVVLAKWLAAECKILLLDEPTRGVDVGAKAEIHSLIDKLACQGVGVMLISSELPEVINLSTRIIVLRNGKIAGELPREKANQESVMKLMAGIGN